MQTQVINNNNTVAAPVVSAATSNKSTATATAAGLPQISNAATAKATAIFLTKQNRLEVNTKSGLENMVSHAIREMASTGVVFARSDKLVGVDFNGKLHTFNSKTIRLALCGLVQYVRTDSKTGSEKPTDCPRDVGETIAAMSAWQGMPTVAGLSDHPVLTVDNRLTEPGFDTETEIYSTFDKSRFTVPDNCSIEDASSALTNLMRLLQTFDFEHAGDAACALSAIFTATSRVILPAALQYLIDATESGSGKGYFAQIASRFAKNEEPPAQQLKADNDEMSKVILSVLKAALPVCFFDELGMASINLLSLRTFGSAPLYGGRTLGLTETVQYINRVFVIATGNNVSADEDMCRRMAPLRLNPGCENPSGRTFVYECDGLKNDKGNIIKTAKEDVVFNRDFFINKVLIIQRAFLQAQKRGEIDLSEITGGYTPGGYEDWETLCRLPVAWLTGSDPCERMREVLKNQPSKGSIKTIMAAWLKAFAHNPTKIKDALNEDDFMEVCEDNLLRKPGSKVDAVTLGRWLIKHKGQLAGGLLFEMAGEDSHTRQKFWRLTQSA